MWGPSGCQLYLSGLVMWGPHRQPGSPPVFTYGARLAHMGPSRHLHRSNLTGPIWAMWFKWVSGIWDPYGQPQIYPMWASDIRDPRGQPQIYPMWASGMWEPCGIPRWIPSGYVGCIWGPFSPSGTQSSFAPWHPSGAHVGKSCIIP